MASSWKAAPGGPLFCVRFLPSPKRNPNPVLGARPEAPASRCGLENSPYPALADASEAVAAEYPAVADDNLAMADHFEAMVPGYPATADRFPAMAGALEATATEIQAMAVKT